LFLEIGATPSHVGNHIWLKKYEYKDLRTKCASDWQVNYKVVPGNNEQPQATSATYIRIQKSISEYKICAANQFKLA
jgi:hypothetical protein